MGFVCLGVIQEREYGMMKVGPDGKKNGDLDLALSLISCVQESPFSWAHICRAKVEPYDL